MIHSTSNLKVIALLLLAVCNFSSSAQNDNDRNQEDLSINLDFNDDDGVFNNSKAVQVFLDIQNNTSEYQEFQIEWGIFTDDKQALKQMTLPAKVNGESKLKAYCPLFEFPRPGFYQISAKVKTATGDNIVTSKVLGINPEQIITPIDSEPDFEFFWNSSIKKLAKIEPDFEVIAQERPENAKTNLYKIEMKSFGGLTVRGWLEVPKKKGIYPALLRVPGYSGNMKPIDKYNDMIVFSFNPRDHGESDSTGIRNWEMWVRGLEAKEEYYYRGIYLDCIRAVDYLVSREDVDAERIAIWGGSQGGGLSLSTAALDQRIDLCIADIPWMCEWQRFFEITHWDEIDVWFANNPDQNWQSMLKTFSYFDTKNMATWIKCPVVMGIGLQDAICPPVTSFATYNQIEGKKQFTVYKNATHYQPRSHYDDRFRILRKSFEMEPKEN